MQTAFSLVILRKALFWVRVRKRKNEKKKKSYFEKIRNMTQEAPAIPIIALPDWQHVNAH